MGGIAEFAPSCAAEPVPQSGSRSCATDLGDGGGCKNLTMELNYEKLNAKICVMRAEASMVNYIYETQGTQAARVDFNAAAKALGCHRRTVSRYVKVLVACGVLKIIKKDGGWAYQLSPELIN